MHLNQRAVAGSNFIITRDSEVIMFSPGVFVCLCRVCVCGCLSMFVTMFVRTI